MKGFGVKRFLYPSSLVHPSIVNVVRFANRSSHVSHHMAVDDSIAPFSFGPATVEVLWPPPGYLATNENHHSVVLSVNLGSVTFVLTGDAEADVWSRIVRKLPTRIHVFQVPHHGAYNSLFTTTGATPWLNHFVSGGRTPHMAMSSHIVPHSHPDPSVVAELDRNGITYNRTDENYHITFETNGTRVDCKFYQ
jgi:beta-lactamase superfamily II metal-dependent hydrolase